ncbi:hypothetical protein [Fusobacterium sp.]|uniref:hypothetical protein n=1 Tax=Fusobacterium sp. TaxID=68766 RepID=UPI002E790827|nr:hypothetical protein [Fusobacterium sp.]MEE1476604.1 hypothetical protein [Fusobacterium sp.]
MDPVIEAVKSMLATTYIDSYLAEFERQKGEKLTDTEQLGVKLFFSGASYEYESVVEALENMDMKLLRDILNNNPGPEEKSDEIIDSVINLIKGFDIPQMKEALNFFSSNFEKITVDNYMEKLNMNK